MGVAGIAVGTLVSRIVELIIVLVFTFCIQKKIPVKLKDFFKTEKVLVKDYVRYGVPVLRTDMQWAVVGLLKVAIIGHVSAVFMAANSIANSMIDLSTLFAFSLANGACVVVGKAVGRGDYTLARQYSCLLYTSIQEGDRIAVGVSGGKDSITLLYALRLYQYFSKAKFEVVGITLDMGLFHPDTSILEQFCQQNQIEYHVVPTQIRWV